MYSLLHKVELAHECAIWSVKWAQLHPEKPQTDAENENSENPEKEPETPKSSQEDVSDFIVTGGLDDCVKIWKVKDDKITFSKGLEGHSLGIVSVDVSSTGRIIASSSLDSTLCLWDTQSGQLKNQLTLGPVDLWTVAFSPCDKYVISGSHDGKITLYSVEAGMKAERVLDPQNGKFTLSLAYSPDGKFIASGGLDGIINIFDVNTGKVTQTLEGHAMSVRSLSFSPDSQMLLTASDDGHMKLYDIAHSDVAGTISGHASWVLCVAFSPDGKFFTSSSSDKSVKIWDLAERKCLHTFNEHSDQVWGVKYNFTSNRVVSVSEDKSINLYDCPSNVL